MKINCLGNLLVWGRAFRKITPGQTVFRRRMSKELKLFKFKLVCISLKLLVVSVVLFDKYHFRRLSVLKIKIVVFLFLKVAFSW